MGRGVCIIQTIAHLERDGRDKGAFQMEPAK